MNDNLLKNDIGVEIQIDGGIPFVPEKLGRIGFEFGEKENTQPTDRVRRFELSSCIVIVEYVYQSAYVKEFYKSGKWMSGTNDVPRFAVSRKLEHVQ